MTRISRIRKTRRQKPSLRLLLIRTHPCNPWSSSSLSFCFSEQPPGVRSKRLLKPSCQRAFQVLCGLGLLLKLQMRHAQVVEARRVQRILAAAFLQQLKSTAVFLFLKGNLAKYSCQFWIIRQSSPCFDSEIVGFIQGSGIFQIQDCQMLLRWRKIREALQDFTISANGLFEVTSLFLIPSSNCQRWDVVRVSFEKFLDLGLKRDSFFWISIHRCHAQKRLRISRN